MSGATMDGAAMVDAAAMAGAALLGDIGGTNARFALSRGGRICARETLAVADYPGVEDALAAALERLGAPRVSALRLAVAGVVAGGRARLTNGAWRFDAAALARRVGAASAELCNDAQAAALGLPRLAPEDSRPLGGPGALDFAAPAALVSVGTGLGVSLLPPGGGALATEAGHIGLPAADAGEARILARLRERFGRVSAETVLSGAGLCALCAALGCAAPRTPEAAIADALAGRAPAAAALERFCAFLGAVAGDLALAFGAWGGVAIAGGVPRRFAAFLRASPFRARFEAKGRFAGRMRRVPTVLVARDDLALLGLAAGAPD